jgi:UDP-N-acetylmuramoyl-L-alanyl-D-glutamate--2,6-diaminopimelate ligase
MKLAELAKGIGILHDHSHQSDREIVHVTHDSRKVMSGSLFVAIDGEKTDGHRYIGCASQLGAVCIMTNKPEKVAFELPVLQVENPREAMALVARKLYGYPDKKLIVTGVTGTNGKTTTTYLLNHILRPLGRAGRIGTVSYYNGVAEEKALRTTPEAPEFFQLLCEMVLNDCKFASVEVSSHGLYMKRVFGLELSYALFTNLTRDHLDFHGTMEAYFQAKALQFKLLKPGGMAILNADDAWAHKIEVPEGRHTVWFGQSEKTDLRFRIIESNIKGSRFEVTYQDASAVFELPILGDHNVYNFCAALPVAVNEGRTLKDIAATLGDVRTVPGRCEMVDLGQNFGVVVDYAHTPDALVNILQAMRRLNPNRLITLFGAGGDRDQEKRIEMGAAAHQYSDVIVLTSDNPRSEDPHVIMDMVAKGIDREEGEHFIREVDRKYAIERALAMAEPGDVVVLAGKGHEVTQEIKGRFYPFSDREMAADLLQAMREEGKHV